MTENYRSPWMNEELEIFRGAVRRFIAQEFAPQAERWNQQKLVDREAWNKAGEIGLLCPDVPECYGGGGGSFAHDAVTFEELMRAGITSFGNAVHSIVAHYLLGYGSEAQKQRWLPRMASGEMVAAIAMTEPAAGSDLQGIRTRAVRAGGEYVLNGSKIFITNGYHADLVLVVAKTDPAERGKGISLIAVETRDLPGYQVGRVLDKIGQKGQDTVELFFDDCRVPAANLLGDAEGRGFHQLMNQLPRERLMLAVMAVAAMERAVAVTSDYAKQRRLFGQRLIELQNTRFKLAECRTEAFIGRVFVDYCIERLVAGDLDTVTASMAKYWATEKQFAIANECLQLHGGYGYMLEYPIAHMFADARVQMIYGGSNEVMKELIARSL